MRIGLVCSSGGSTFQEVYLCMKQLGRHEFIVVTDRPCGFEAFCDKHKIRRMRIEEGTNASFSKKAAQFFKDCGGVDLVLLAYLRIVTRDLFAVYKTLNIHPSLLPAFRGFGALKAAKESNAEFFGATLHEANDNIDAGPVVAQVSAPLQKDDTLERMQKISFIQKVYLGLIAMECAEGKMGTKNTVQAHPALTTPSFIRYMEELQEREGIKVFNG